MQDREEEIRVLAKALRELEYEPEAGCSYEWLSGGFIWSDEMPAGLHGPRYAFVAFKKLIAYCASLILGRPRKEFEELWQTLERECSQWPGFRPERRSPKLSPNLERANEGVAQFVEKVTKCMEAEEREQERKEEEERRKKMLH